MAFAIFAGFIGGGSLWSETQPAVVVSNASFQFIGGGDSHPHIGVHSDRRATLEVTVEVRF